MLQSWSIRNKVVVITGAAGGIGLALATAAAECGARVVLLDLEGGAVEEAGATLRDAGHDAVGLPCDVTDAEQVAAVFRELRRTHGGVDLLVNNAGLSHRSLFIDTAPEVLRRVMEVNFFGSVNATRAALPDLVERRGRIAVVSTVAGFAPLTGRTGYAASKHALHGFFDTLRAELHDAGVRVTIVCPWFVATAMRERAMGGDGAPVRTAKAEVGPAMTAEEVAQAILAAVRSGRRLVALTPRGRFVWWLSRVMPALYERLMRRSQAREFGTGTGTATRNA